MADTQIPFVVVVCTNSQCPRVGERRTIHFTYLGQHVYAVPALICGECYGVDGWLGELRVISRGRH